MRLRWLVVLWLGAACSCAGSDRDRAWVMRDLHRRLDGRSAQLRKLSLQARMSDGIDEDDVVAIALEHNPTYQIDLARIEAARADLDEASRPENPQLTLVGPFGPISGFATLLAPLQSLWQLPYRSAMAARTLEATAASLVQSGLDVARDARLAHITRGLAEDRVRIRGELLAVWSQLEQLGWQRVELGEAPPAERAALQAEAALALDARALSESELEIAEAELRAALGLEHSVEHFSLTFARAAVVPPPLPELLELARQARPDVCAAKLALAAAGERAGWERSRVVALAAQVEGHRTNPDTFAARLGGRVDLPLFGANPGGIGRAEAEIARATAAIAATRQRVVLELVRARTGSLQAQASLLRYRSAVLPALSTALSSAQQSYELGEESYVVVLDIMRRNAEARLREAELIAQTRRAGAELERAIGARLGVL